MKLQRAALTALSRVRRLSVIALVATAACGNLTATRAQSLPGGGERTAPAIQLQLACLPQERGATAITCDVYVAVTSGNRAMILPRIWLPFRTAQPSGALLELQTRSAGAAEWVDLWVADGVRRGRYENQRGIVQEGLLVLSPGDVFGRRYEIGGADWELPFNTTLPAELRARLTIELRDREGNPYPAVRELAGGRAWVLDQSLPNGVWLSEPVPLAPTEVLRSGVQR